MEPNFAALDAAPRVLGAGISAAATSLTIESGYASLPASSFEIKIADEIIAVGARSAGTLSSLTRGSAGTSAAPHNKWDAVVYGVSSTTLAAGGGGGSSTPAGSDGQIQFNDADAFGASSSLVWEEGAPGTAILKLVDVPNGIAQIIGNASGVQLQIIGADGTDTGGEITIEGGGSVGGEGGQVSIAAGADATDGNGGFVRISSGFSLDGDGGDIDIRANGHGAVGGRGGDINVVAGPGFTGGNVLLQGGSPAGNIQVYSGDGNQYVQLDNNGLQIGATKLGFFQGPAVVQPAAPVTLDDVIAALKALGLVAT